MNELKDKGSRILNAVSVLLCLVLLPVIVFNLSLIVSRLIHPDDIPGFFGIKPVAVLSGSMEDTIMTGDLILIEPADTETLKEGDVICYLLSGQAVTHRIDEVLERGDGTRQYLTKGDANNTQDREAVTAEQIQGIWKGARYAGVGNFVLFLSSPAGMAIFIVCPIVALLVLDGWRRRKADRKEKARTAELEAEIARLKADQEPDETKEQES